jgi:hypothetical protein
MIETAKRVVPPAPENCNARDSEPHLHNVPDSENAIGYTPDGWLNEYTLMCGYVELCMFGTQRLRLISEGCYHVRFYDEETKEHWWDTFDNLDDARIRFAEAAKNLERCNQS